MTPDQARIVLLEDALVQSYYTIEFLHGCLTAKNDFNYSHPEQTIQRLQDIAKLVAIPQYCPHSYFNADCPSCQDREQGWVRLRQAREVLSDRAAAKNIA